MLVRVKPHAGASRGLLLAHGTSRPTGSGNKPLVGGPCISDGSCLAVCHATTTIQQEPNSRASVEHLCALQLCIPPSPTTATIALKPPPLQPFTVSSQPVTGMTETVSAQSDMPSDSPATAAAASAETAEQRQQTPAVASATATAPAVEVAEEQVCLG